MQLTPNTSGSQTPSPATADVTTTQGKRPVAEILERLGNSVPTPRTTATNGTGMHRSTELGDAVKKTGNGVKKTVRAVSDGFRNAVGDVRDAVKDGAKKMSDAAKPKATTAEAE